MHHRILCINLYVNILNNKTLVGSSVLHVSFSVLHNERIIVNNEPGEGGESGHSAFQRTIPKLV